MKQIILLATIGALGACSSYREEVVRHEYIAAPGTVIHHTVTEPVIIYSPACMANNCMVRPQPVNPPHLRRTPPYQMPANPNMPAPFKDPNKQDGVFTGR